MRGPGVIVSVAVGVVGGLCCGGASRGWRGEAVVPRLLVEPGG